MTKGFVIALLNIVSFYGIYIEAKLYKPAGERVVVFAPHPDDDILGCGGSLIEHVKNGAHITIVYMTSGDATSSGGHSQELARTREKEARKGAQKIGVKNLIFLGEPDGELERSAKNVKKVENLILRLRPEAIYIPHSKDGHRDHKATFWIVSEAAKQASDADENPWIIPLILCYEVWTPLTKVTHRVDISAVIDTKLDALTEHVSQIPSLNIVDAAKSLSRYRGIMEYCGDYGECFQSLTI